MYYEHEQVIKAFKIYSRLSISGCLVKDEIRLYIADDVIRGLVDEFANEVDCIVFIAGDYIYMIPKTVNSVFHVSNESIKNDYLPSRAVNSDIYTMYVAIIVLFGEFYDSYQSTNPTRDFISVEEWLENMNERLFSLKEHGLDDLKEFEKEYEYNWISIIEKWDSIDDLKENVKKQDARTVSRLSFLNNVKKFLEDQELVRDIGNNEIELTEKAKTIIQRYYMEHEFNREILDFMYGLEEKREGYEDAIHI